MYFSRVSRRGWQSLFLSFRRHSSVWGSVWQALGDLGPAFSSSCSPRALTGQLAHKTAHMRRCCAPGWRTLALLCGRTDTCYMRHWTLYFWPHNLNKTDIVWQQVTTTPMHYNYKTLWKGTTSSSYFLCILFFMYKNRTFLYVYTIFQPLFTDRTDNVSKCFG